MSHTCAVLFDIDGTLLRSASAGAKALALALAEVIGTTIEQTTMAVQTIDFRGATDQSIVRQLEAALGVDLQTRAEVLLCAYLTQLERRLAEVTIEVLPGVLALVGEFTAQPHIKVGLLTGNFREAARRKLIPLKLDALVENPGAFGEDGHHRHELALVAAARLAPHKVVPHRIVVVGDTEHDVSCGKHIGAHTVAVGTGWTPWETLERSAPDLMLRDLSDPAPLRDLVAHLAGQP